MILIGFGWWILPLSESTVTLFLMCQFEFVFLFCRWVRWCLLCSTMREWWMFPADSIHPNSMPWYCYWIYWFSNLVVRQHRNIRAKIQSTQKHCIKQFAMETVSRWTAFKKWKWKKISPLGYYGIWNAKGSHLEKKDNQRVESKSLTCFWNASNVSVCSLLTLYSFWMECLTLVRTIFRSWSWLRYA